MCKGFIEGGHFFGHGFGWCFPAEGFSGAVVHQGCNVVEPGLAGIAEIGAFGMNWRKRPLVFLVLPRCQALPVRRLQSNLPRGAHVDHPSQMLIFRRRASSGWQAISDPRS